MIEIQAMKDGPYLVKGEGTFVVIQDGKEERIEKKALALCRCGHSQNKPFCDGSHRKEGFSAEEVEIRME